MYLFSHIHDQIQVVSHVYSDILLNMRYWLSRSYFNRLAPSKKHSENAVFFQVNFVKVLPERNKSNIGAPPECKQTQPLHHHCHALSMFGQKALTGVAMRPPKSQRIAQKIIPAKKCSWIFSAISENSSALISMHQFNKCFFIFVLGGSIA